MFDIQITSYIIQKHLKNITRNELNSNSMHLLVLKDVKFLSKRKLTLLSQYRYVKVSLDMLLKFVVVFGPTIRSTISAPPSVGVDLHAEQRWPSSSTIMSLSLSHKVSMWVNLINIEKVENRRECSNQCFMQLQKIRMILPILVR